MLAGGTGGFHPIGQGGGGDALERNFDAHEKETLLFAAADGEHAVGRDGVERLAPLEVVAEFLRVAFLFFAIHDLGGNGGVLLVNFPDAATKRCVIGHALGDDVAGTGEGFDGGRDFHFRVEELGGFLFGIGGLVFEKEIGERGEAAFDGLGGAGLALRAEGGEDVLDGVHGERGFEFLFELGREERALFEGFQNGGAAGIQLGELEHAVANRGDLDFVERAGLFLPVAGNEGNGAALGDEFGGGGDGGKGDSGFAGDGFEVGHAGKIESGGGFHEGLRGGPLGRQAKHGERKIEV